MLYDNNLIEWSLRLNRSKPLFRTILEQPRNGNRPRTRDDIRLRRRETTYDLDLTYDPG